MIISSIGPDFDRIPTDVGKAARVLRGKLPDHRLTLQRFTLNCLYLTNDTVQELLNIAGKPDNGESRSRTTQAAALMASNIGSDGLIVKLSDLRGDNAGEYFPDVPMDYLPIIVMPRVSAFLEQLEHIAPLLPVFLYGTDGRMTVHGLYAIRQLLQYQPV